MEYNKIYTENDTMQEIYKQQGIELDNFSEIQYQAFLNNFVLTSDIVGVENFERILEIVADPTIEDIDFRKTRILAFMSKLTPLTEIYLRQFLDTLIGSDNYILQVKHNKYELFLRIAEQVLQRTTMLLEVVRKIIPANLTLLIAQLFATWGDILEIDKTWGQVLNADTWGEVNNYTWGGIKEKSWRQVLSANTWGYIKSYRWED